MKKTIAIVAGGNLSESFLEEIKASDIIIGADRGGWWLLTYKIIPHYVVGDFDSVTQEELKIIKKASPNVAQYKAEKDETDLELALQLAVKLEPKLIKIFGSIGSRLDHSLAGIFLLERFKVDITVIDENNRVSVIKREKTLLQLKEYRYCSFIPLTKTAEVTLLGFKYPLNHGLLQQSRTLGVSNELVEKKGKIIVHRGTLLCIQSRG